jgi:outer membrane receptor for ferrienterochelin and colicin
MERITDPAQLRGLGPDQVLVLLNGKRRHTSFGKHQWITW